MDVDETRDEADLEPATELARLVAALVEHGAIRLILNATRVAADLAGTVGSEDLDAARLADALLEQDGVGELFWTDEQLERFLSQW